MSNVKQLLSQLDEIAGKEKMSLSEKQDIIDTLHRWNDLYKEVFYLKIMDMGDVNAQLHKGELMSITEEAIKHSRYEKCRHYLKHYMDKIDSHEISKLNPARYKSQYIKFFTNLLNGYMSEREEKYNAEKENTLKTMNQLPLTVRPQFQAMSAKQIMDVWCKKRRYTLERIVWDYSPLSTPHYQDIYTPVVVDLQNNSLRNFLFSATNSVHWKRLIIQILLSLPVGSVRFSMINLDFNMELFKLEQLLHSSLINEEHVNSLSELNSWAKKKYEVLKNTCLKYGDLEKYNRENTLIAQPYEVCIVSGISTDNYDRSDDFKILLQQGYHAGFIFIVLGSLPDWITPSLFTDVFTHHIDEIIWNSAHHDQLLSLLKEEIDEKDKLRLQKIALRSEEQRKNLLTSEFTDATKEFRVEMGKDIRTQTVQYFELDEVSHIQCLILGKSGAGKSNFIHVLLQNAMLNYGPDTLQLYLLDLKKGGVELNRYRYYPHVRVLQVSDNDLSIALDILDDISSMMEERAALFRESGCNNLKRYNELHPECPVPRILVFIDEFHVLFGNDNKTSIQTRIEERMARIATEGRSQGVHLILATQGFKGTNIPQVLYEKWSDIYFMNCEESDVERLTNKNNPPLALLRQLPKYGVFRQNQQTKEYETFIPYKMEDSRMQELQQAICQKEVLHPVNFTPYYYAGKRTYSLTDDIGEIKSNRYPECLLGRTIKVRSNLISIRLHPEEAENLLIVGANAQGQGVRVLLTSLISLMYYHKRCDRKANFYLVLNGEIDEEKETMFYKFEKWGVKIVDTRATRTALLKKLYQQTMGQPINEGQQLGREVLQYVCLLGQDFYRELRNNIGIEVEIPVNKEEEERERDRIAKERKIFPMMFDEGKIKQKETEHKSATKIVSVGTRQAWMKVLKYGPENGVHCIWQLQNVNKLLHTVDSSRYYMKDLEEYFSSIVFLRMPENDSRFNTEKIKLQDLNSNPDDLKLALYSSEKGEFELLSPYMQLTEEEIEQLLHKEQ